MTPRDITLLISLSDDGYSAMSCEIITVYQNTLPADPDRVKGPYVKNGTYLPRRKGEKNYRKFVKLPRQFRNVRVQLLDCMDHDSGSGGSSEQSHSGNASSASSVSSASSAQSSRVSCGSEQYTQHPRVFKAMAEFKGYEGLIVFKVVRA